MIKWVSRCLLIVWLVVIFGFSNQDGGESSGLSEQIAVKIVNIVDKAGSFDWTESQKDAAVSKITLPIRKAAHMIEYAILALLAYNSFSNYGITIILVFVYASIDEIHQLFIPGRAGRFTDVLIDTTGGMIMVGIIWGFRRILNRKR